MEPCSQRLSGCAPCAPRVLGAGGITRVVVAVREPAAFVAACSGLAELARGGVAVEVLGDAECAARALAPNQHLALAPAPQLQQQPAAAQ